MNRIWVGMILISIIIGIGTGRTEEMVNSMIEATKEATENSLSIIGMICFWAGMMKIAEECGMIKKIAKMVRPLLRILFPKLKKKGEVEGYLTLNMTANLLGLGNVATPLGLNAIKKMQENNPQKERLTDEMMMLIVLNTASIQLIPTSIIALRASYQSKNSAIVVIPILMASFVSVIFGVVLVKLVCRKRKEP